MTTDTLTAEAVRAFVLETLAEPLSDAGLAPADVPPDFDLLERGIIDSLGILELIEDVNAHFGLDVDFEALDPESLTVVSSFCDYVASSCRT